MNKPKDGISISDIEIRPYHLLSAVCVLGGVDCPLPGRGIVDSLIQKVKDDPTLRIKLASDVDEIPNYKDIQLEDYEKMDKEEVFNRKRDLDILQRLGLMPGDIRRARYLFELLFQRIETPVGICSYNTPGWEGCPEAGSGVYENVRNNSSVVYMRSAEERRQYKNLSVQEIKDAERLYIRPHHLMCMCCRYNGGEGDKPSDNDNLYELMKRIQENPDVEIALVEGCCMACDPCDGYDTKTGRCVHGGGLIRDYKKDLDIFQKLGLMPGATMKAREILNLLFKRIPSTKDICGYGDGIVTSHEWSICGDPEGNEAYKRTIKNGIFLS